MRETIRSGIDGLDEIAGGGFHRGDTIGIEGSAGTGKTILCTQFLYKGAVEYGERGLFISVEKRAEDIRSDMLASFGWNLEELEREGTLRIGIPAKWRLADELQRGEAICMEILELIGENDVDRVVIDSLSAFTAEVSPERMRDFLHSLTLELLEEGVTTLVTVEKKFEEFEQSLEDYFLRGKILLRARKHIDTLVRTVEVAKMEGAHHSTKEHLMKISKNGIVVYPDETVDMEQMLSILETEIKDAEVR